MTFWGPPADAEPGIGPLTMGGLLAATVESWPEREALCFHPPGGSVLRWTYRQLDDEVQRLAAGLIAAGVGKGTRVGLLMGGRPEWVVSAFAIARVGGVVAPINTLLEGPELLDVLGNSDVAVLLYQARLASHDYAVQVGHIAGQLPYLQRHLCLGTDDWRDLIAAGAAVDPALVDRRAGGVSPYDDGVITTTSGTTDRPKSVLHAHRGPALQSYRFVHQLGLDETARVWSAFPFFWSAGFCMVMGASLAAGACLVLQELFEPGEALRLLETERVTSPHAWVHQFAALEDHPKWATTDLSTLQHVDVLTSFGRHPTVHVDGRWSTRAAYGLTETFTIATATAATAPPAERDGGHHGPVLPGNAVRIVDPDTGALLGPGQAGEIRIKGPTLMKGYLKIPPEKTFDVDGFFATGDAGFVDEKGRLHWTGRSSGLIKTAGANVSPVEVETALLAVPELKASVAVGVPHPTLGEMLVVCAVAHPGTDIDEEKVRAALRGRLASYKIPKRVLFVEEADLELTGNAKLRADSLRKLAIERLDMA